MQSSSEAVLLVHSGGFSSRQWRRLGERLAPTHRVIAPDLLGYGASGPWPAGAPFEFAKDVALLESLVGDAPVLVVGHSYGGLLALHLALARPVRSLALFEPVAFGVLDDATDADARALLGRVSMRYEPEEAWLTQFVDWWNGPGTWAALPEETRASFRAVGWKVFQEVASLMRDDTDSAAFGAISAPTLLMGGARTPLPERHVLEKLATAMPHATLQIFPDMGHMGPITHASIVNDAIVRHLTRP
jgi:pimeloyl-ACP methyl ester carboxylesterase